MKVVIDDKIPYIKEAAERLFTEVVFIAGNEINASVVKDADAMIIRTRTHCDKTLLEGSAVKYIATATIGYDHIDTEYLAQKHIGWTNCPGCNASSVAQYVESCMLLLEREKLLDSGAVVGIVGVGHVGRQVAQRLQHLGYHILYNDPPRQHREQSSEFCDLGTIAEMSDVITFHTPLTQCGEYKTYHLADSAFFSRLKKKPVIINAARGGVVEEKALYDAYQERKIRCYILDTWENEPKISSTLLHDAFIATPHVAGYSADGKSNASQMALTAVCKFFGLKPDFTILPPPLPREIVPANDEVERKLQLYNPLNDSEALKSHPEKFEYLRGNYPLRREHW